MLMLMLRVVCSHLTYKHKHKLSSACILFSLRLLVLCASFLPSACAYARVVDVLTTVMLYNMLGVCRS